MSRLSILLAVLLASPLYAAEIGRHQSIHKSGTGDFGAASATDSGLVSTGTQTIPGTKTFTGSVIQAGQFYSGSATIADDDIHTITLAGSGRGMMFVWASSSATAAAGHAIIAFRADTFVTSISASADMNVAALGTALTQGTGNGVDTDLNIGVQTNNTIILKNRVGGSRSWGWLIIGQ